MKKSGPPQTRKPGAIMKREKMKRRSISMETISSTIGVVVPPRMASTPTRSDMDTGTPAFSFEDRSPTSSLSSVFIGSVRERRKKAPGNIQDHRQIQSAESLDLQLDFEYTRYLQAIYAKRLVDKEAAKLQEKIGEMNTNIQSKIASLTLTDDRLKNIKFYKKVQEITGKTNWINTNVNSLGNEQKLQEVVTILDRNCNRLEIKSVEFSENISGVILPLLKDSKTGLSEFGSCSKMHQSLVNKTECLASKMVKLDSTLQRSSEKLEGIESDGLSTLTLQIAAKSAMAENPQLQENLESAEQRSLRGILESEQEDSNLTNSELAASKKEAACEVEPKKSLLKLCV